MMHSDSLWTAKQVAELLNVQLSTVYALCRRRALPHLRLTEGAQRDLIRFDPATLREFLASRSQDTGIQ